MVVRQIRHTVKLEGSQSHSNKSASEQNVNINYYCLLVATGKDKYRGEITISSRSQDIIRFRQLIIPFSVEDHDCCFRLSAAYERVKTIDSKYIDRSWKKDDRKQKAAALSLERITDTLIFDLAEAEPIVDSDPKKNVGGARYTTVHSAEICAKLYASVGYRVCKNMQLSRSDIDKREAYHGEDIEISLGSYLGSTLKQPKPKMQRVLDSVYAKMAKILALSKTAEKTESSTADLARIF